MGGRLLLENFQLDLGKHALLKDGENIAIEPRDFRVLVHLVSNAPDCVSTELLLEKNWTSSVVGDNSLHQVIRRLRVALGDSARSPKFIQTLAKVGYRFIAPIEDASEQQNDRDQNPKPVLVKLFHNYSADVSNPFVASGLQIELSQRLAKSGVHIISQESVTHLGTATAPSSTPTNSLNIRFVLTGTIAIQSERLRVNACLNDLKTNRLLWSETYDCDQNFLFETHSLLATKISDGVLTHLLLDPIV